MFDMSQHIVVGVTTPSQTDMLFGLERTCVSEMRMAAQVSSKALPVLEQPVGGKLRVAATGMSLKEALHGNLNVESVEPKHVVFFVFFYFSFFSLDL